MVSNACLRFMPFVFTHAWLQPKKGGKKKKSKEELEAGEHKIRIKNRHAESLLKIRMHKPFRTERLALEEEMARLQAGA